MASTKPPPSAKKTYYLGMLRVNPGKTADELVAHKDTSHFGMMTRASYAQGLTFSAKTVAERIPAGSRDKVAETSGDIHVYATSFGFSAVLITEGSYDKMAGQAILAKAVDDFKTRFTPTEIKEKAPGTFDWPQGQQFLKEAVNAELTGIAAVRKELDETKIVLHDTIQSVLERGEKLDTLVQKSDELGMMSKGFYKTAKQQNSCCVVM